MSKIISFDVWDTLIKRKCHPEEIKLFTAKYIMLKFYNNLKEEYKDIYVILELRNEIETEICSENEKSGHDRECRIYDVFIRLLNKICIVNKENKEEFKIEEISKELIEVEIEKEKDVIYVNEKILPIIEKYKDLKMYCISDFYMESKYLKEILNSVGLSEKFEKIYSSADMLLNKRTGNLYKFVENELKVKPEEHIHVGDNIYSDIQNAKNLGIQTIQIENKKEFDFIPVRERQFDFKFNNIKIKNPKTNEEKLYNMGVDLSPLLYFFVEKIIENGIQNNIEKIYYQTREGETFIKIHEMIFGNNGYGKNIEIPKSEILEVSRLATFSASFKEMSIEEVMRQWRQYKEQNLKAMFKTLDFDVEKYKIFAKKYNIDIEEKIKYPWKDERVKELFLDKEFINKANEDIIKKKKELISFFENKGIRKDNTPLFVVDMGWRGTIQDNLAYIFDNKVIGGYYYALYDFFNKQPEGTYKLAYIQDRNITYEYIEPMIMLFEMLFNTSSGSVISYKDGQAIRKVKESEYNTVKETTSHIQKGMLKGSEKINEYMRIHPYENSEFDNHIYSMIKKIKTKPPKMLMEAYYSLVHNDTFGTGEYVDNRFKLTLLDKLNLIKSRNLLRDEHWKEAFIEYNNVYILKIIVNIKGFLRKILGGKKNA